LESFSYALQFDMHFYMHSYVDKIFILVKSGCYSLSQSKELTSLAFCPGHRKDSNSYLLPLTCLPSGWMLCQ
jgi:hypothetical protein